MNLTLDNGNSDFVHLVGPTICEKTGFRYETVKHQKSGRSMRYVDAGTIGASPYNGFVPLKVVSDFFEIDQRELRRRIKSRFGFSKLPDDSDFERGVTPVPIHGKDVDGTELELPGPVRRKDFGDANCCGNDLCKFVKMAMSDWKPNVATMYSIPKIINKVLDPSDFDHDRRLFLQKYHAFWNGGKPLPQTASELELEHQTISERKMIEMGLNTVFGGKIPQLELEPFISTVLYLQWWNSCGVFADTDKPEGLADDGIYIAQKIAECSDIMYICAIGERASDIIYSRLSLDDPLFGCVGFDGGLIPDHSDLMSVRLFLTEKEKAAMDVILKRVSEDISNRKVNLLNSAFNAAMSERRSRVKDGSLDGVKPIDLSDAGNWPKFVTNSIACAFSGWVGHTSQDWVQWFLEHVRKKPAIQGTTVREARDLWVERNCGGEEGFETLRKHILAHGPRKMTLREAITETGLVVKKK